MSSPVLNNIILNALVVVVDKLPYRSLLTTKKLFWCCNRFTGGSIL